MSSEYIVLANYLGLKKSAIDQNIRDQYEYKYGKCELTGIFSNKIYLYLTDTLCVFFSGGCIKTEKLMYIVALVEVSEHYEELLPKKISLYKKIFFLLFLTIVYCLVFVFLIIKRWKWK